jgi:ABC-2 type transport system ATP-binding protein
MLLLDEPSNGLDPAGVVEIRDLLHDLAHLHGVTILLSSHILTEVARLADRIGIIHRGRLIEEVDAGELPARLTRSLLVSTRHNDTAVGALRNAGYQPSYPNTDRITLNEPDAVDRPDEIATLLVQAGCPPTRLQVDAEELETYFLRRVGDDRIAP